MGQYVATAWYHDMEMLSVLLALCEGNPMVTSGLPHKGTAVQSFDVFFVVIMNKLLNKQLRGQYFEVEWYACVCHSNGNDSTAVMTCHVQNVLQF